MGSVSRLWKGQKRPSPSSPVMGRASLRSIAARQLLPSLTGGVRGWVCIISPIPMAARNSARTTRTRVRFCGIWCCTPMPAVCSSWGSVVRTTSRVSLRNFWVTTIVSASVSSSRRKWRATRWKRVWQSSRSSIPRRRPTSVYPYLFPNYAWD